MDGEDGVGDDGEVPLETEFSRIEDPCRIESSFELS
jgi:hypothetical protein